MIDYDKVRRLLKEKFEKQKEADFDRAYAEADATGANMPPPTLENGFRGAPRVDVQGLGGPNNPGLDPELEQALRGRFGAAEANPPAGPEEDVMVPAPPERGGGFVNQDGKVQRALDPEGMYNASKLVTDARQDQEDYAQRAAQMGREANESAAASPLQDVSRAAMGARNVSDGLKPHAPPAAPPKPQPRGAGQAKGNPLADAFKKNELALAFDTAGVNPETQEVPQNTSDAPEAQVDNKTLAKAVNATSAATSKDDVEKAAGRPHGVQDQSAYWAALKDMASGFDGFAGFQGMKATTGYYDARMKEEGNKQAQYGKDVAGWQQQTRDALRQKFEGEQKGLDRDLTSSRNKALSEQAAAQLAATTGHYRALEGNIAGDNTRADRQLTESERHNRAMEARKHGGGVTINNGVDLKGHAPLKPAQEEVAMRNAEKHQIPEGVEDDYKFLEGRLNDPTPLSGMDLAAGIEEGMGATLGKVPYIGDKIVDGMAGAALSQESKDVMERVHRMKDRTKVKTTGMAANPTEIADLRKRLGMNRGDANFRLAVKNEIEADVKEYNEWFKTQHPQIQQRLIEAGEGPKRVPKFNFEYNPKGKSNAQSYAEKPKEWITETFESLRQKFNGDSEKAAVELSKMQQEEEARKKARPQ
jgi:hypothetical protein